LPSSKVNSERQFRFERNARANHWRRELDRNIPPLFCSAHIRNIAKRLIANIDTKKHEQGLLLWGKAGVGKSHIACALLRRFICRKRKVAVKRISFEMLCLKLRGTFTGKEISELDILSPLLTCDLLVLEDLGTSKSIGVSESDFSLRTVLALIDSRIENCLPTIVTTNKSLENLAASFDDRIASRLSGFKIIKIEGADKRAKL
jgi:DNA replication protein DnaC